GSAPVERKNPRDLRLVGNRSSQPPSASRALVLQATSATASYPSGPPGGEACLAAPQPPRLLGSRLAAVPPRRAPRPSPPLRASSSGAATSALRLPRRRFPP